MGFAVAVFGWFIFSLFVVVKRFFVPQQLLGFCVLGSVSGLAAVCVCFFEVPKATTVSAADTKT
jgi:hypothetical protein